MSSASHSIILQKIAEHAIHHPHKTAIVITDGDTVSYMDLMNNIRRGAQWFIAQGVNVGDRILLSAQKEVEFIYLYLGAHLLGIVNVVIDAANSKEYVEYIASVVKPVLAIGMSVDGIRSVKYSDISLLDEECRYNDITTLTPECLADIMFTSGTTGKPKGVCLSHFNINASAMNINRFIGNKETDIELLGLPICHSFGLGRLRCNMLIGATVVLHNGFANLKSVFSAFERYHVTGFGMVPAVWAYIKRFSGKRIGRYANQIRYIEIGSAPMAVDDKQILLDLFPNTRICMHYGLTEASRAVFMEFHQNKENLETVGKNIVPEVDVKILRPDGSESEYFEEGEICIKGNMVMKRYVLDEDNINAFHGEYFRTGDIGMKKEDGNIYLTGRAKEIINIGGKKVSPIIIENAIKSLGIEDCACIPIKDPNGILGEVPKVYIQRLGCNMELSEIKQKLVDLLKPYEIPVEFQWIDSVPRTPTGKLQRFILMN